MNDKVLLDSNIIIYAMSPEHRFLIDEFLRYNLHVSAISRIEVLGFSKLSELDKQGFSDFFKACLQFAVTDSIIETATSLRQQKKMSLGDAVIASTALTHNLPLMTRNDKDFDWISGLDVVNPFK